MEELELSLMMYPGYRPEVEIRPWLDQFESEQRCKIRLRMISWETGRAEFAQMALSGKGPDVSEIGTTWCPSYVALEALRPFSLREVELFGGAASFLATSWQSGKLLQDHRQWAIPWLATLRVLYYRRDLLKQAGIDEKTAFLSHVHLVKTLESLGASGVAIPLSLMTRNVSVASLHSLASWVWGAGGDFLTPDGTRTQLRLPETRAGIRSFLELGRFLSPAARELDQDQAEALFWQGQAAVTLSWQPPLTPLLEKVAAPEVIKNLGAAPVPGRSFIGGSNLVIWRHISVARQNLAIQLIYFLTSQRVQQGFNSEIGFFPVRPEVLNAPPFSTDAFYPVLAEGLDTGRRFPNLNRWGLIEERLGRILNQLWEAVLSHPEQEIEAILAEHLDPMIARLDHLLEPV